ncbi:transmembrane protein 132D-like [Brienomyrus brachyistius]|uniref:transmembrane protein 132D-like n=1 Tax=Brienomyrus brachyistius TaxID=42636 RepID=UPI0020B1DF46|nr:transmembrane protein 132D-like [Brienomyrus brachyistius]
MSERSLKFVMILICVAVEGRLPPEGVARLASTPMYLPVDFQLLNAEAAFFLREANQDIMRNSSLRVRTEPFFVYRARRPPSVSATYGPLSVEQVVPPELLQAPGTPPGPFSSSAATTFPFNWKVRAVLVRDWVVASRPKVQTLFHVTGWDWDDYTAADQLPCVTAFAFHETQEVRASCRLQGALALCVAELEPLASWFDPPSVVPGRQRAAQTEGTPVELYYVVRPTESEDCGREDDAQRGGAGGERGAYGSAPLLRIGSVRLFQSAAALPHSDVRMDDNFMVQMPPQPVRRKGTISVFVATSSSSLVEMFTLRVRLQEGVAFLGARPSNPLLWTVSQEARSEGHREVTLHCHRKTPTVGQRSRASIHKVLQVDLEVDGLSEPWAGRSITWQVEYPGTPTPAGEAETVVYVVQEELQGILPLAMDAEILNTAVLTGRTVAVPVKVVAVGEDGVLDDVTESVECHSADDDVVKVSERCDYVYVNGKERRGRIRMLVNFTLSYLSTHLEMTVWMPQLPLSIQLSDTELSQIKGWRVPLAAGSQRLARDGEDDDDEEQRGRGCPLQYQHALVRVFTRFVADPTSRRATADFLLGSDWQVDVSDLVRDRLKVVDRRVAQILDGQVLMGLDPGVTAIQVLSPLSDAVLAERTVKVLEDKVTIVELAVQLVAGLSLSLQLSPGSNRAIIATATTQEVLNSPKQESLISAWMQFSDGTTTPLDLYKPEHFVLTAVSLDESVVRVWRSESWRWPVIVTQAEGQGALVRVELSPNQTCQRSKRRGAMATGTASVRVKFGGVGDELAGRRQRPSERDGMGSRAPPQSSGFDRDSDITGTTNTSTTPRVGTGQRPVGREHSAQDSPADFPEQPDLPVLEDDLVQSDRGLSDLEIGMYALLGVFCLAILVFLINCIAYALKYRHKQPPTAGGPHVNHSHDWVWLGAEADLLESHAHLSQQQDDEGGRLLNGTSVQKDTSGQGQRDHKMELLNSPTSKRKRVKFATFGTAPPGRGCPSISPLLTVPPEDIKWVCQDMELGNAMELRDYMDRLSDNGTKMAA